MKKTFEYIPVGVCSRKMIVEVENDTITKVEIIGGCPGNTVGLSKLCEGRKVDDVLSLLKGIPCGMRGTSCPDQLATALEKMKQEQKVNV
ncbi:MAG: TIGR03905 family TSCPD domain-containing protein [Bacilli bacterium]